MSVFRNKKSKKKNFSETFSQNCWKKPCPLNSRKHSFTGFKKWMRMIRKYLNHTLQTNPRHCEEEPQNPNSHMTPGRQVKCYLVSSLRTIKMIAKLDRTQNTAQQSMEQRQNPTKPHNVPWACIDRQVVGRTICFPYMECIKRVKRFNSHIPNYCTSESCSCMSLKLMYIVNTCTIDLYQIWYLRSLIFSLVKPWQEIEGLVSHSATGITSNIELLDLSSCQHRSLLHTYDNLPEYFLRFEMYGLRKCSFIVAPFLYAVSIRHHY